MALTLPLCPEARNTRFTRRRVRAALWGPLLALVASLGVAAESRAASISIDPLFSLCNPPTCSSLTVQLNLALGEIDADSFSFDINVDFAPLIGLSIGPIPGNPIAGLVGGVELLANGTTIRALLNTGANPNFDGPGTFDLATIPLSPIGNGTVTFSFLAAEIVCESCGAGGTPYPVTNPPNGVLAQVTVTPEPGSFALLVLGLGALGAARRNASRQGGIR